MSLFGNTATAAKPGGLFGASTTTTPQPAPSGGLFGASTTAQQPAPLGGLFGSSAAAQQPATGGGLFGAKPAGSGLFGASTAAPTAQPATGGLFGSQQPATGGGLFGSSTAQQQQPTQSMGLFGASQPQQSVAGGGLFGINASQQQRPQEQALAQSFLAGSSAAPLPRLGQSQWMREPGPREKTIHQQFLSLFQKWHPLTPQSEFQHYFYTNVGVDRAPYFGVPEGEDPHKWEDALKSKPSDGDIPVLARGFAEQGLAGRIKLQYAAVNVLNERVREIDQSLATRIEDHDLKFTVRTAEARRRQVALSRRCLALATKVQVLRNRGYALDAAEEEVKVQLAQVEKQVFDPVVTGRQEELWARMTVVRERVEVLKREVERMGKVAPGNAEEEGAIDEETMGKVRQILTDYDSQLAHLRKELEMIKKEFETWQESEKPVAAKR